MISKWTIVLSCTLVVFCESAYVETLQKCAIDDPACLKGLIQNVLSDIGKGGIEEYGLAPVDPLEIKDLKVSILELMTINIVEGEVRGIKDCVIDNIVSDAKERRFVIEVTCDLNIKVKVKLGELSPYVQNEFGSKSVEGGGNAKIKLDKLHVKLEYFYDIIKKEDGETYIKCKSEKTVFEYQIGEAKVVVDKLLFGDEDFTEQVNGYFEKNWNFAIKTFGKSVFDLALDILNNIIHTFFDKTPTKYFITNELSIS
ncbi:uncharacterized protein LOC123869971 [Maniola jurtina]|uniref:uncharacterized protein LOC123869971 n=1 Tax=Maniola jurtina TaxID=191418 RepID=UPI001E68A33F|nr:uncharacterized protein LOC123869971 [Maniola jurtina]